MSVKTALPQDQKNSLLAQARQETRNKMIEFNQTVVLPLKSQLTKIADSTEGEKMERLVSFFRIIAPLVDSDVCNEAIFSLKEINNVSNPDTVFKKIIDLLGKVEAVIAEAGRGTYVNISLYGQPVTNDVVLLGGVLGVEQQSVSFWLENKEFYKNEFSEISDVYTGEMTVWYIVNDYHAGSLLSHYLRPTIAKLELLLALCEELELPQKYYVVADM